METSADAAEVTSHIGDALADIPATSASAVGAETPDCQTADSVATAADPTACSESMSVPTLATSTDTALTSTLLSSVVQSTAVVEEPSTTDEQSQCSECKKSFRSDTLLEYHKKYYHRVTVTDTVSVASRRPSLPSPAVERAPSGRFRSKNKSTCKGSSLKLSK